MTPINEYKNPCYNQFVPFTTNSEVIMYTKDYWIKRLQLTEHQEGGYFFQTYVSDAALESNQHPLMSSIYFLLTEDNPSHFHRLSADEMWYYHFGESITIHMIHPDGRYEAVKLGLDDDAFLQYVVPAGVIFGSIVESHQNCHFSVVGCAVTPAFTYDTFELFERETLLSLYPQHAEIIKKLTRD